MDPYLAKLVKPKSAGKGQSAGAVPPVAKNPVIDALSRDLRTAAETSQNADIRAAASVVLERMMFLRQAGITFHGARDLYDILGYDRLLTYRQYRDRYARGGIAGRIVDALTNATWRGTVSVQEDKDEKKDTPFEKSWKDLDTRLQVQAKLQRGDKLSQLSTYSVLLIGAAGELETELPKLSGPDQKKILYLTTFSGGGGPGGDANSRAMAIDADCTIQEFETDVTNVRFALPKFYRLQRRDVSSPAFQRNVHWTRVIHLAEGCLFDDVYGQPSLERVWNLLDDLDKVTGGGAEAFWLRANQGLHLDIDKDMNLPSATAAVEALKEQSDNYKNQITRWIRTRGVKVKALGSDVAMFGDPTDAILTQIAGAKSIPKRILTGSEMGELASSQDRDNWKDQINGRQTQYAGPYVLRPLVDRLVLYGYIPPPSKGPNVYEIVWPHIQTLTEDEKSKGAKSWADTNLAMKSAGQPPAFTSAELRDKWYDLPELTPAEAEKERPTPDPVLPGMPPGAGRPPQLVAAEEELLSVLTAAVEANNTQVIDKILGLSHKLGSTQLQLPSRLAEEILAWGRGNIAELDLVGDGRESDIHVTVKYGLSNSVDAAQVESVVKDTGEVFFTLGEMQVFAGEEQDVLYIRVQSPQLMALNARISQALPVTDTHPEFKPHVTVAYLQPGAGEKYKGNAEFAGKTAAVSELVFSSAQDEKTTILLGVPLLA